MVIHASYLARWKEIHLRRQHQQAKNNARENRSRIPYEYKENDLVLIRRYYIERKLNLLEGPFKIVKVHTNGTVSIQRSPTILERINIRRIQPVSIRSN